MAASVRVVGDDVRDSALLAGLPRNVDVVCHQAVVVGHGIDLSNVPD